MSDPMARLALAYHAALAAGHGLGRPEIHVGEDLLQWMRDQCTEHVANWADLAKVTCWGIPVVPEPTLPGDHLSVHVVTVIE